jgi:hypothetical protein
MDLARPAWALQTTALVVLIIGLIFASVALCCPFQEEEDKDDDKGTQITIVNTGPQPEYGAPGYGAPMQPMVGTPQPMMGAPMQPMMGTPQPMMVQQPGRRKLNLLGNSTAYKYQMNVGSPPMQQLGREK